MSEIKTFLWAKSKYWWAILIVGILLIPCGIFYLMWPVQGYEVASLLFGWALILLGIIQIVVGINGTARGRIWWIIGGFIDLAIGFLVSGNLGLAESVFPYFLAIIFLYWGILDIIAAFQNSSEKYWWMSLINGMLLSLIGVLFISSGTGMFITVDFLLSVAFIYWGISLILFSIKIKHTSEIIQVS